MQTRYYGRMIAIPAMLLLAVVWLAIPANAIPAFARRAGGVSCAMCHWHQNALNATGKAFLRSGFRLAEEKADATSTELRLSHYGSLVLSPGFSAVKDDGTRFSAGDAVLWLGGPVDDRFSAIAETEFHIDDEETEVEEIYAQYVSDPGSKYTSLRVGQFQPLALLGQVSGPPRIALSRPAVISGKATNGNGFRPRSRLRGAEFGTVNGPVSAYLGIGNGQGQNAADNHMDIYATVEREIGNEGSSVGAWGYWGEAVLGGGFRDTYHRYAVIGNYTAADNRVVGAIAFGKDGDPGGSDLDNNGWFIEGAHKFNPETAGYVRWDQFNADLSGGGESKTHGPTLGISWTLGSLTRFTVEGQFLDVDGSNENSLSAEMQIAF